MAALLTGQSSDAVAASYNLPIQTVLDWQRQARLANEVVQSEKKGESNIAGLIDRYLVRNLETISVQAEHFADRSWLAEQPAAEAAVLHGVLVDKAVRILEALEGAGEPEPQTGEAGPD